MVPLHVPLYYIRRLMFSITAGPLISIHVYWKPKGDLYDEEEVGNLKTRYQILLLKKNIK